MSSSVPCRSSPARAVGWLLPALIGCAAAPTPPPRPPAPAPVTREAAPDSANVELREFTSAAWRFRDGAREAVGARAMVTSNNPIASQVGLAILRAGGNAVDAAVAIGFALAVAYPEAGNLGGGGFLLGAFADGGTLAVDYRETAPAGATRDMFLGPDGAPTAASRVGHRASGVPGSVAGLWMAHRARGRLPWAALVAPAESLAAHGIAVDSALRASLAGSRALIARFAGAAVFLPGDSAPSVGTRLRQPALAATLARIRTAGPDGFYRGPTADAIVAEMRRGGGLVTHEDLAGYRPRLREALRGTYRGRTILAMPPVSSGGVTILEALNVLETWPRLAPPGTAAAAHQLGAVLQRAYADRNALLGDPDVVAVPVAELTGKARAARLRATIREDRATPTPPVPPLRDGPETTHYNVVDAEGNAVAVTTTINDLYGSGVYVPDAGFFLNDEMDDFAAKPGTPNAYGLVQGEANAVAPGKRMLSSMSPVIVLDAAGRPALLAGARGGSLIISAVLQIVLNVVEHGMPIGQAIAAPRWHHQGLPDVLTYEEGGPAQEVLTALSAMGWSLRPGGTGRATAIQRGPDGTWRGVVDPRREGLAIGY